MHVRHAGVLSALDGPASWTLCCPKVLQPPRGDINIITLSRNGRTLRGAAIIDDADGHRRRVKWGRKMDVRVDDVRLIPHRGTSTEGA